MRSRCSTADLRENKWGVRPFFIDAIIALFAWRGRVTESAEGDRLLSDCALTPHRGFESHPFRHFFYVCPKCEGSIPREFRGLNFDDYLNRIEMLFRCRNNLLCMGIPYCLHVKGG